MKLSYFLFFSGASILGSIAAYAQNTPGSTFPASYNSAGIALPPDFNAYPNTAHALFNYNRVWTPRERMDDTTGLDLANFPNVQVNTTYINGWGQTLENISRTAAGNGNDIINITDLRRLTDKPLYLPYTISGKSKFQQSPFTAQKSFYNTLYGSEGDNAYSRTSVTSSTNGGQTITGYAPGANLTGSSHGSSVSTITNTSADNIRIWLVDPNTDLPYSSTAYAAGVLTGKKTVGQHGAVSVEWMTPTGQKICKTVDSNAGASPYLLTTYYVYNDLGRLHYIITPKATDVVAANGWAPGITVVQNLCYHFEYNDYGQIVKKETPGKLYPEYTVYDQRHRPVLMQTPLLRQRGKWAFMIYDSRDRVRFSGYISDLNGQQSWQSTIDGLTSYSTTTDLLFYIYNGFLSSYPSSLTNCDIREYCYYDDYSFPSGSPLAGKSYDYGYNSLFSVTPAKLPLQPSGFVNGLLTGKKVKVINPNPATTNQWTYSAIFYDNNGRAIQTQTLNPWNSTNWDVTTTQYNFSGNAVQSVLMHYAWSSATKASTKLIKKYNYDVATGRLTNVQMRNDAETFTNELASYTYDNFGRVAKKTLGSGAEIQNYEYNIRGQLTGINTPYLLSNYADMHFGCSLSYDYGFYAPRYDGSISGFIWRGTGPSQYAYGYNYDAAGRLTAADFVENPPSLIVSSYPWNNTNIDYSVSNIKYDPNGNILSMKQRGVGVVGGLMQPVDMDDLSYTYSANSNRLSKVDDAVTLNYQLQDFLDGTNTGGDYTYDDDGNLKSDANKGITAISYNALDLPDTVTTAVNGTVANVYDAEGTIIEKTITFPTGSGAGTNPWVYRYWGPFVYRNDSLLYELHDEGRARWMHDSLKFKYDFFVKDHLGNVRSVITRDVSTSAADYLATHEVASANLERLLFSNIEEVRAPRPGTTSTDNLGAAKLNGGNDTTRIGTAILLQVMAGDKFQLSTQAYYDTTQNSDPDVHAAATSMLGSIISTLSGGAGGFGHSGGGEGGGPGPEGPGGSVIDQLFNAPNYTDAYDQIKEGATNAALPRAYLNYISFDEQMQIIPAQSGAIQIDGGTLGQWGNIGTLDDINVAQNGYLAVYISNEQFSDVYFDNVRILHYRGRLLEEQHYYPFGLTIRAGANTPLPNNYLYQGNAMQDEGGLKLYDFHARQYDPQVGRFGGIDPMDQFASGYTGMGNNPANMIDPNGMQGYIPPSQGSSESGINRPLTNDNIWGPAHHSVDILDDPRFLGLGAISTSSGQGYSGIPLVYSPSRQSYGFWVTYSLYGGEANKHAKFVAYQPPVDYSFGNHNDDQLFAKPTGGIDGKGNSFRGGSQNERDGDMNKFPKQFRKWYHENKKDYVLPGQPDPDLEPIYKEWQDLGKPSHVNETPFDYNKGPFIRTGWSPWGGATFMVNPTWLINQVDLKQTAQAVSNSIYFLLPAIGGATGILIVP